jgi:hypothetical protein
LFRNRHRLCARPEAQNDRGNVHPKNCKLSKLMNVNTISAAKNDCHSWSLGGSNSRLRSVCSASLVSFLVVIHLPSIRAAPANASSPSPGYQRRKTMTLFTISKNTTMKTKKTAGPSGIA